MLLDVDAYTKADNRASEWYSAFEAAKADTRYCTGRLTRRRLEESSGARIDTLTLVYLRKPLHQDAIRSPALHDAQRVEKDFNKCLQLLGRTTRADCSHTSTISIFRFFERSQLEFKGCIAKRDTLSTPNIHRQSRFVRHRSLE